MKIIVSTISFAKDIRNAIDNKTTDFEIIGEKSEIVFSGKRTFYGMATPIVGHRKHNYKGKFDLVKWYQILCFIKQLEEQPIVIEFNEYMHTEIHDEPEIELCQFIKRF